MTTRKVQAVSEICPVCQHPRERDSVCPHWVADLRDGWADWDDCDQARDLSIALDEFAKVWWRTIPKARDTRGRVRKSALPAYLLKAWRDGGTLSRREKTKLIVRLGGLLQASSASRSLYVDEEGIERLKTASADVRRGIEVIEEIRDDVLFDLYFDECIQNGMNYEDICRDLDFEQWAYDHWLCSLTEEEMKQLAGNAVKLAEKTNSSTH